MSSCSCCARRLFFFVNECCSPTVQGPYSGQALLTDLLLLTSPAITPQLDGGQQCLPVSLDSCILGAGAGFPNRDILPTLTPRA